MPTGTANKNVSANLNNLAGQTGQAGRDELDVAICQGLRRATRPGTGQADPGTPLARPDGGKDGRSWSSRKPSSPKSAPQTDPAQEESLLKYVEGTLSHKEHAAFERRLLEDPYLREQAALLKSALCAEKAPEAPPGDVARVRYVFSFSSGVLRFLRGTDRPLPGTVATLAESAAGPQRPSSPSFDFTHHFGTTVSQLKLESAEPTHIDRLNLALSMTEHGRPLCGQVSLWRDGQAVEPAPLPLDPDGKARFHGLLPARYELVVTRAASEVGRMLVDIRSR